jgi:DNA-binding transcriptional MerR regulator
MAIHYSDVGTFNIKVVVSGTGLKPDTIRAWERRYGLPMPERTPGGHRLYSELDIETLKWLIARRKEGLTISKAVLLWRQLEADGRHPLEQLPLRSSEPALTVPAFGKTLENAREEWVDACLRYDETAAERILAEAFAEFPIETVSVAILQKGLSEIGDLWYANRANVQQEHFASELATRRLEALLSATPPPNRAGTILVSCATEDTHVFPALLLVLFLRRRGYRVVYLGASMPIERLEAAVDTVEPRIVILTAQHILSAATLQEIGFYLDGVGVRMAYGGWIFNRMPALRERILGEFLGERLEEAASRIESALKSSTDLAPIPARDPILSTAVEHYQEYQSRIEKQVWDQMKESGIPYRSLETAHHFLGQWISAALRLGDMAFMVEDLVWIEGLLENYGANHGSLAVYLTSYRKAAHAHLDERAAPILDWLDAVSPPA